MLYEGIGDQGGWVRALYGLGVATHGQGQGEQARRLLQRALEAAVDAEIIPLLLSVLVGVGTFLVEYGSPQWGVAAWTFVQEHPATDQMTKDKVRQRLEFRKGHGVSPPADAQQQQGTLISLANALLTELSALRFHIHDAHFHAASSLSQTVSPPIRQEEQALFEPLSDREQEVLALVAQGLKNQEIADQLFVTLSTIKAHSNNIYRKLDVKNRVQAVARAQELGLL
jgi:ATP/maltotriose-dependent transcriptional regulator MalT